MTPEFFTYKEFLAIQNHFRRDDFSYFFYNGNTRLKESTFLKNKNYQQFIWLARKVKPDRLTEFLACNFAYSRLGKVWISDLILADAEENYQKFRAYKESQTYRFIEDLKRIPDMPTAFLIPQDSCYPRIIIEAMSGGIALETLCILTKLHPVLLTYWNLIDEAYLWPTFRRRVTKFTPFLKINVDEMQKALAFCDN